MMPNNAPDATRYPRASVRGFCGDEMREYRDASNRLSFDLSLQEKDFGLFAKRMIRSHGKPTQKLGDPFGDQRYWDFNVDGTTIVLHSDVMAGVSIHVEDGSHEALLRAIATELTKDE